jgi:hypothetical protein
VLARDDVVATPERAHETIREPSKTFVAARLFERASERRHALAEQVHLRDLSHASAVDLALASKVVSIACRFPAKRVVGCACLVWRAPATERSAAPDLERFLDGGRFGGAQC